MGQAPQVLVRAAPGVLIAALLGGLLWVGYAVVFPKDASVPEPAPSASAPAPASALASASAMASASASAAPELPPAPPLRFLDEQPKTMEEQRAALMATLREPFGLDDAAMAKVGAIFEESGKIGQGHPTATEHPMSKRECLDIRAKAEVETPYYPQCGGRYMVPIYNPKEGETADDAPACIDAYEFPGVPCEYPVTWVTSRQAAQLCEAVGKRLCDAHEWEGACAGAVLDPAREYHFDQSRKSAKNLHNRDREIIWAYGAEKDHAQCATGSRKSEECGNGGKCGSNTYPTGAFPKCQSKFGVFDLHGNAAEHMNLPTADDEFARDGKYGETEMKGSWFIFQGYEAHEDDCRWRAPDWHVTEVMDHNSHANYHLSFRCCRDVEP